LGHFCRSALRLSSSGYANIRSDLALIDILADVRRRSGIRTPKIHITGFSGGAQFAHRFAFYHADVVGSLAGY
jgi:poly(3-hydroxybutyrate) depolymerase